MTFWRAQVVSVILLVFALGARADGLGTQDDLRVLDGAGLVRASHPVHGGADILVTVANASSAALASLHLTNVDGLFGDRKPAEVKDGAVLFEKIPAGTWRIAGVPSGHRVERVTIRP